MTDRPMNQDQRWILALYLRAVIVVYEPWTKNANIPALDRRAATHNVTQARRNLAALVPSAVSGVREI